MREKSYIHKAFPALALGPFTCNGSFSTTNIAKDSQKKKKSVIKTYWNVLQIAIGIFMNFIA